MGLLQGAGEVRVTGYTRPDSLAELLAIKAELGARARLIAGGTDLMIKIRAGQRFEHLVNISRVSELAGVTVRDNAVELGATVTVAELGRSTTIKKHAALLTQAAERFASPLVRSRATVGGNLANASPAADIALSLLALDGVAIVATSRGSRELPLADFFVGPGKTALGDNEVLTRVRVPMRAGVSFFEKSGPRPALEIAVASLAMTLSFEGDRVIAARLAFGAVAPVPMRGSRGEEELVGRVLTDERIEVVARVCASEVRPIDDVRASAVYRRRLVAAFVRRLLAWAKETRRGGC